NSKGLDRRAPNTEETFELSSHSVLACPARCWMRASRICRSERAAGLMRSPFNGSVEDLSLRYRWLRSLHRAPAFLADPAKAPLDKILRVLLAVKLQLPFEAELEQSRCHA